MPRHGSLRRAKTQISVPVLWLAGIAGNAGLLLAAIAQVPTPWALAAFGIALLTFRWHWGRRWAWLVCVLVAALLYGNWRFDSAWLIQQQALPAPESVPLDGRIEQIDYLDDRVTRFRFRVTGLPTGSAKLFGQRLRLSWYQAPELLPHQHWRLRVKLKPPHGLRNQGGFDYERWLFAQRLVAIGRVSDGVQTRSPSPSLHPSLWLAAGRQAFAEHLQRFPAAPLLRALALGDRSALTPAHWRLFQRTGTSHLFVVSGLHVSLLALCALWLGSTLARCASAILHRGNAVRVALPCALLVAAGYVVLSGSGLPAVRAWTMAACAAVAVSYGRLPLTGLLLCWLLVVLLLIDPLLALQAGTWLSFGAVAVLLLYWSVRQGQQSKLAVLLQSQLLLSLATAPLLVAFGFPIAPVGPLANLLVVPLVTLLALPLALLGALFWGLGWSLANPVLDLAGIVLQGCTRLLEQLSGLSVWWPATLSPWLMCLVMMALTLALRPLDRWSLGAIVLAVALVLTRDHQPRLPHAQYRLHSFDVGQGAAVLVQTRNHALLYDAAPSYPGGGDLGRDIVVPGLRRLGVESLDALVVSHADSDHAGGAAAVLSALATATQWHGEPDSPRQRPCHAGVRWQWDGVQFAFLHPVTPARAPATTGNDRSCVLHIQGATAGALLTGDISAAVEAQILRRWHRPIAFMQVPHHGSRSSSSSAFVRLLRPRVAVVSAARYSRYGHPNAQVLERYERVGTLLWNTGEAGAVQWHSERPLALRGWSGRVAVVEPVDHVP